VREHVNYRKNDRWRSYRFYKALQRLKSPMRYICEIFGALRFSSFSTQSVKEDLEGRQGEVCSTPQSVHRQHGDQVRFRGPDAQQAAIGTFCARNGYKLKAEYVG
jgi:hypothetical protein